MHSPGPAPDETSPPSPAPPTDEESSQKPTGRRNGFVARKPQEVREKINLMLLDGITYPKIVENLGEDGKGLNEDSIGTWARGGYQDWLDNLDRAGALRFAREATMNLLKEKAGTPVQDAARTVAATQLYELLISFDAASFAAALANKPELYLGIVNALSRLCEGDAACNHRRTQQSALESKLAALETPPDKKLLTAGELKKITHEIKIV